MTNSIQAEIHNFRGITEAKIDLSRVALLVGKNYSGKTSVARAIASAITGENTFDGLKKAEVKKLVNNKSKTSLIKITTNTGEIIKKLPDDKISTTKNPNLYMSPYAAGIKSILDKNIDNKARSKFFIELLEANPTKEDLNEALASEFIDTEILEDLWTQIEQEGWDNVYDEYTSQAKEKKGAWKEVTHETYGKVKAQAWTPDEAIDFETLNIEEENSKLIDLQIQYENSIKDSALHSYRINELEALISNKENYSNQLKEFKKEAKSLNKKLETQQENELFNFNCPECKIDLLLERQEANSNILVKSTSIKKPKKSSADITKLQTDLSNVNSSINKLTQDLEAIKKAEKELAKINKELDKTSSTNPDAIQSDIETLKLNISNYNRWLRADQIHNEIEQDLTIANLLSPTGLRKQTLTSQIEKFNNDILASLCKEFNTQLITLDEDMNVYFGDNIYHIKDPDYLLSKCEQYMVRTVLQVAIAKLDGSSLIIIDNADELNSPDDKSYLFNMVIKSQIPTLICMAMQPTEKIPNLSAVNVGITYKVDKGIVEPLENKENNKSHNNKEEEQKIA